MTNWKKGLIGAAAAVLLFGGGYYAGRSSKPAEERREQSVQVEQKHEQQAEKKVEAATKVDVKVADKTKSRKRIRIITDTKPDGSKHRDTTITDVKDNDVAVDVQYVTSVVVQEKTVTRTETKYIEKSVYIIKRDPPFSFGIHAGYDVLNIAQNLKTFDPYPKVGAHAYYRFLGPLSVYGECNMKTSKLEKPEVVLGLSADL